MNILHKELNESEKLLLVTFKSLVKNNVSVNDLTNWQIRETNRLNLNTSDINWLKISIHLDSKNLIEATFNNAGINKKQIDEAITYAATFEESKTLIIDQIGKNMVEQEQSNKHAQQHPSSLVSNKNKQYDSLSTFEYLKERAKDFFSKKTEIKFKVTELRNQYNQSLAKSLKP